MTSSITSQEYKELFSGCISRNGPKTILNMVPSRALTGLALCALSRASVVSQLTSGRLTGNSFGVPFETQTYDYIIVGGGLAGSLIAARLTENSNATVALIEAGGFYELTNGNISQIPFFSEMWVGADLGLFNPLVDWGLDTVPQVNNDSIRYAQGRNLGGSSGRNQMLYHRPTKGYYEQFAEHVGDLSYTWDNMTTYLERSMTFTPPLKSNQAGEISYDASAFLPSGNMSNPLQVTYPGYNFELSLSGPAAFENIGLASQAGVSSGVLDGYSYWTYTIDPTTGTRSSSESSFLQEGLQRESLNVFMNSLAQNVVFNGTTAVGVNITTSVAGIPPRYYTLSARREVLLAAGAWHSPQLLMLSGIGPNETLNQYGIPVISALEGVGQNMWDTTNIGGVVYELNDTLVTFTEVGSNATLMAQAIEEFRTGATGPLTQSGSDMVGWYKFPESVVQTFSNATQEHIASLAADWPELELSLSSSGRSLETGGGVHQGTISCLMIGTAGRGNMTIQSNSILDRPIINPNWLRDPRDQEVAVASLKAARQAWQGVPESVRGQEIFPGANMTSDEDLLQAAIGNIAAIHHCTAGCAMGRSDNPQAVVDSRGRVFGVQGLRVVDSSALPFTPPGHTQGVTYGHAEKMAAVILEDMFDSI